MAILLQWTGSSFTPNTVAAGVSGGDITNGSLDAVTDDFTGGLASDPCLRCYPAPKSEALADAVTNNSYWYFTLTPDGGKELDLTSMTFLLSRGGASTPRGYALRSSIDAYAANIATADCASQTPSSDSVDIDLSGAAYQGLTAAITFRLYYYGPSENITLLTDTLTVNGTVSALAGGGTCPVSLLRHRLFPTDWRP